MYSFISLLFLFFFVTFTHEDEHTTVNFHLHYTIQLHRAKSNLIPLCKLVQVKLFAHHSATVHSSEYCIAVYGVWDHIHDIYTRLLGDSVHVCV